METAFLTGKISKLFLARKEKKMVKRRSLVMSFGKISWQKLTQMETESSAIQNSKER